MSPDTATTAATSTTQETGNVLLAGLDGGVVRIARAGVDDLAARVEGHVLFPGDASWDESVLIWNAMVARTPALVLQPKTAGDVATGIGFARDHGLLLSIKGGGHNIAGTSLAEGGLTLDMSLMCDVTVDPEA
jgi:FAD/FMN-containing dehydrogenase